MASSAHSTDVLVVGGGPAGSAAAITLARAGRDVILVDKAVFPRDKFCGDGLTTDALRLLEGLGLDPARVPSWQPIEHAVVRSPSGRVTRYPLPTDAGLLAATATRADLDAALLDEVRRAGVDVREGHAVTATSIQADRVVVQAEGIGPIHARYAIGADGMWSPLRKQVGLAEPGYLGEWHAFRQYFRRVHPDHATTLYVWFEPEILPGYLWSFPLAGGRANVGFGIHRGGPIRTRDMKDLWPELLARPALRAVLGPDAEPEGPHRAWPIPARVGRLALGTDRVLFVGDAAAATDPMTGEGIAQALWTGIAAADAISEAGPSVPAWATASYERAVASHLVPDHWLATTLGRMLATERGARAAVKASGVNDWTRRNFARWLFEDYPRAILLTPWRWRRGMFTRPGAYAGVEAPRCSRTT